MRISVRGTGGEAVIAVSGQAWCRPDADVLLSRMKELATGGTGTVVVDLDEIQLAGAAFLGALAGPRPAVRHRPQPRGQHQEGGAQKASGYSHTVV